MSGYTAGSVPALDLLHTTDAGRTWHRPRVTADGGEHWQFHWFPGAQPRPAPASPSVLPTGLPWLATTATDARHAWLLFGSANGSGDSYLYATADGGATWQRIATFR